MMQMNNYGHSQHRPWRKSYEPRHVNGGQSYAGSNSVGSRLAGIEPTENPPSATSNGDTSLNNQSPFGDPHAVLGMGGSYATASSGTGATSIQGGYTPPNPSMSEKITNLNMQVVTQTAVEKAENFKTWSVKTYKCTKQIFSEKFGKGTKTVDVELEAKITDLRETKRRYENLVEITKALNTHIGNMIQSQKVLSEAFSELSLKSKELKEEFQYNSETQKVLVRNGESLLAAVNFFVTGVHTLCDKTIEDTIITIGRYESARIEFDAYRTEVENLKLAPRNESNNAKLGAAQVNFNKQKELYERLRDDVTVKMQFLEENRVKVMKKHLLLFHNAITAFFAGNQQMLESTLAQFSIKMAKPGDDRSFLETH